MSESTYIRHSNSRRGEIVQHLVSGCKKLAHKEYKRRLDNVAKKVNWHLFEKNELDCKGKWYEHVPEGAVENEKVRFLWDINTQCCCCLLHVE